MTPRKRQKISRKIVGKMDLFDALPDDLVISVLSKLSSSASSLSDFFTVRFTCKRLNRLGSHPMILANLGVRALEINPQKWSESAHRFLADCTAAGNLEAAFTLGMIRFYCLEDREGGASLMARAAMRGHAQALYSLAVIHFNGSGRSKDRKDLKAGVALCARAACLGHVDALRELGHCLQDGYGVRRNVPTGRRLIVHANTRELVSVLHHLPAPNLHHPLPLLHACQAHAHSSTRRCLPHQVQAQRAAPAPFSGTVPGSASGPGCPIMSDYGCDVPVPELHPAHRFLVGWYGARGGSAREGLRLCCHAGCGRPETRPNEFRRCSVCNKVNYCSRGCQALDWKMRHKEQCAPEGGLNGNAEGNDNGANGIALHNYVNGEMLEI